MPEEAEFSVTFRNGALERLKKVAADLGVTEDQLGNVLIKGLKLIDMGKEGNNITIEKDKQKYVIDLRSL